MLSHPWEMLLLYAMVRFLTLHFPCSSAVLRIKDRWDHLYVMNYFICPRAKRGAGLKIPICVKSGSLA